MAHRNKLLLGLSLLLVTCIFGFIIYKSNTYNSENYLSKLEAKDKFEVASASSARLIEVYLKSLSQKDYDKALACCNSETIRKSKKMLVKDIYFKEIEEISNIKIQEDKQNNSDILKKSYLVTAEIKKAQPDTKTTQKIKMTIARKSIYDRWLICSLN